MSDKEQIQQIKKDLKNDYPLIPMNKIEDEARLIAIAWHENATDWIGDKHKLASDIMNYARRAKLRSDEEKDKEIAELKEGIKEILHISDNAFQHPDFDKIYDKATQLLTKNPNTQPQ